ncbi:MAG: SRPBCC domain-containing protein [Gammaproteobacteria bacterium]|nr:SRPBCC domain-containing protein [Gammaproteobacteria bacterium]
MASFTIRSDPVTIEAPVEKVWRVLTDFERYGEWNPFTPDVRADLTMGARVDMRVTMGAFRLKQTEIICALEPPRRLAWRTTIGARWLLHAVREQRLEMLGNESCRYVTEDEFKGVLMPLVILLTGGFVRRGFNAVAAALKQRAEAETG